MNWETVIKKIIKKTVSYFTKYLNQKPLAVKFASWNLPDSDVHIASRNTQIAHCLTGVPVLHYWTTDWAGAVVADTASDFNAALGSLGIGEWLPQHPTVKAHTGTAETVYIVTTWECWHPTKRPLNWYFLSILSDYKNDSKINFSLCL